MSRTGRRMVFLMSVCILAGTVMVVGAETKQRTQGAILFEDTGTALKLFGKDLEILRDKVDSIPEEAYDPACYSGGV